MGKYPVTNAQYAAFVAAIGHSTPDHWQGNQPPSELANHPVVNVTWHDAGAFCAWLSEQLGGTVRLPSEAEWEKAAKGNQDNRQYPWGDEEPDENRCNFENNVGSTTTVGMYPMGISPYQCHDLSGNVSEWTSSVYTDYPYTLGDRRENADANGLRVMRGGAFPFSPDDAHCASRSRFDPDLRDRSFGFRLCAPGL
jgi:formylglycine-generating enzyme required for sulfatase activity